MTSEITTFLARLNNDYSPIKDHALKYVDNDSSIRDDGALQIYKRPWIAPQNYGLLLFPPVDKILLGQFKEKSNIEIPEFYQEVLLKMNGCFIYDFSLFGLPNTIYKQGLLNRNYLEQYDLNSANVDWRKEYAIDKSLFHFGGRAYSNDENIGYFINTDKILLIRKNGEIIDSWSDISDFLKTEIKVAEQIMIDERDSPLYT